MLAVSHNQFAMCRSKKLAISSKASLVSGASIEHATDLRKPAEPLRRLPGEAFDASAPSQITRTGGQDGWRKAIQIAING
jgi:hypothetical protein